MIGGSKYLAAAALLLGITACSGGGPAVVVTRTVTAQPAAAEATTKPALPWILPGPGQAIHIGRGPDFPDQLDGWELHDDWTGQVRAFGGQWMPLAGPEYDFPATMNGCDNQRFLVRWRALSTPVISAISYSIDQYGDTDPVLQGKPLPQGMYGWADIDGCQTLAFTMKDDHYLADLAYSVQQWWPTA